MAGSMKLFPKTWWMLKENDAIPKKLNIGCGNRQFPMIQGWINLDIDDECSPDVVRDVKRGLPFPNDYFTEVLASHVLEHLEPDDVFFVLREIHRVCKPGAILKIIAPHWKSEGAFDIDHRSFITVRSFALFRKSIQDITVQNNRRIVQNCFWEAVDVLEDIDGKNHPEPQIYITLKCDKSEIADFKHRK